MSAAIRRVVKRQSVLTVYATHSGRPGFDFRLTYSPDGVLVGLDVSQDLSRTPVPLNANFRRDLPIAEIDRAARAHVSTRLAVPDKDFVNDFSKSTRVGRRGHSDLFYARIAHRYIELLPYEHPSRALQRELGQAASTIKEWLRESRRRGLLTPSPPGRPGGTLTTKCEGLLT